MNLPILRCSYCMRKVGLWNFFQMEGTLCDVDVSTHTVGPSTPSTPTTVTAAVALPEGQGDQPTSASSTPPARMKLRSQDFTRSDQASFKQGLDRLN